MPDIPNRDELERKLAKKLKSLFEGFSGHLLEELENAQWNVNDIPESVWAGLTAKEKAVLLPFLENVFIQSADTMLNQVSIGVDWALVNQNAADWARSYSTFLAGQIDTTSRAAVAKGIRNSIASFYEDGLTMGELVARLESDEALKPLFTADVKDRIGRIYGPRRAQMIAVTEVTRASVQGEIAIVDELSRQGINMIAIWETNKDEKVCPICEPRQGKKRGEGWNNINEPPAHPNCRCTLNHDFVTSDL